MKRIVFDRIEGLVNQGDLNHMKQAVEFIVQDLLEEGFNEADIKEYLQGVVRAEVDAVASVIKMV